MKREISWGSHTIEFTVAYSNRKTLGISVMPDKCVMVQAPINSSDDDIDKRVSKRASWIVKQWHYFDNFGAQTPPRRFISGESHLYMGRQYMLKVTNSSKNSISYKGRLFEVECTKPENVEQLFKRWYLERAKVKFAEIAEPLIARFAVYGVEPSSIYVQQMSSRWGSCSAKGRITLNVELIKAPKACIEYVIMHELCHLIHPNHTRTFYKLLESEMPDWKRWKEKLEMFLR